MKEQYQLCVRWAGRGLSKDSMRLASIEGDEWGALCKFISANESMFPKLREVVSGNAPYDIASDDVDDIAKECDTGIDYENVNAPEQSALLTLSMFLTQAQKQRHPSVSIVVWPGKRFETQVYVQQGVDLLADLVELNQIEEP